MALLVGSAWGYLLWMEWGMRHMAAGAQMLIMPQMVHWDLSASQSRLAHVGGHDGRHDAPVRVACRSRNSQHQARVR